MTCLMDRPPGCSFLGSKAKEVEVSINRLDDPLQLIFDSGSDITLISQLAYDSLRSKRRICQGQHTVGQKIVHMLCSLRKIGKF